MENVGLYNELLDLCLIRGNFKLRSGLVADKYFDKYQFQSNPIVLNRVTEELVKKIKSLDFDIIAALEMGAISIGTMISTKLGKPVVFVRKKAKDYGTKKIAEGIEIQDKKLLIIEDVVTTGGAIFNAVDELRNRKATISDVVCVLDRGANKEDFISRKLNLHYLFKANF